MNYPAFALHNTQERDRILFEQVAELREMVESLMPEQALPLFEDRNGTPVYEGDSADSSNYRGLIVRGVDSAGMAHTDACDLHLQIPIRDIWLTRVGKNNPHYQR
jgi:hypothetical protein